MTVREMIRKTLEKQKCPPVEWSQPAHRPDRTPPDERPRPTDERAVIIWRPVVIR